MIKRILILVIATTTVLLLLTMGCDEADGDLVKISIKEHQIEFDENLFFVSCTINYNNGESEIYSLNELRDFSTIQPDDEVIVYASAKIGHCVPKLNGDTYTGSSKKLDDNIGDLAFSVDLCHHTLIFSSGDVDVIDMRKDNFHFSEEDVCLYDKIDLPNVSPSFVKYGYESHNWNTKKDGSGIDLFPGMVTITEELLDDCCIDCFSKEKIVLYPKFIKIEYSVVCNVNDGIHEDISMGLSMRIDESIRLQDPIFKKSDSIFRYWLFGSLKLFSGNTLTLTREVLPETDKIVLCAQWAAQITPDLEYCTSTSEYEFADYGEKWFTTITPKPHYSLPKSTDSIVGATYTLNADGTATISTDDVCEPIRYAIAATPIEHKVTFDLNGGVGSKELIFNEVEMKTFPTPTKDGHIFDGWYDGDTKIDDTTGFVSDITLKAKWTAIAPPPVVHQTYLVRFFDSQGGNLIMEYYTEGPVTTPETPSRAGYEFSGWESTGGVLRDHIDRDTDYYATWNPIPVSPSGYVISFHLNEGEDAYYKCNSLELEGLPTPTSDGKRFDHWYYIEDGEHKIFAGVCNKDIDVYASWVEVKSRFHLDENGDVWFEGDVKDMTSIPVKEGYEFDGWYVIIEGERFPYKDGLGTDVYASWKRIAPPSDDGGANLILPIVTISSIIVMVAGVAYLQRKLS